MTTHALDRRWLALILLCLTQFMVVLDVAIVNVALPSIQTALHFSTSGLQWVATAYALTFGGFLLLGGRCADLLGRRRLFMAGLIVFSLSSLACGLAGSAGVLVGARAVQGVGAAIISPAALSILTTTFEEGRERNTALGVWGAISGLGGAAGVLLGGVLTQHAGWEWIFYINVPIGAAVFALSPVLLRESRLDVDVRRFDVAGGITVTGGLVALVYALVGTQQHHWLSVHTIGVFVLSGLLLAAFLIIETRTDAPLLPLSIFRLRSVAGANVVGLLLGSSIFSMFYFLSLYMQDVQGWSPQRTGLSYLTIAVTIIIAAGVSQALVTRVGVRTILAIGMALLVAGIAWFTLLPVHGSYLDDLVPGFVLAGIGLGFAFVPDAIAALEGVKDAQAGVASGLINTSQQIGGALGLAVLVTVAVSRTKDLARTHVSVAEATTGGFHYAFAAGAVMAAIGLLATLLMIRPSVPAPESALAGVPGAVPQPDA